MKTTCLLSRGQRTARILGTLTAAVLAVTSPLLTPGAAALDAPELATRYLVQGLPQTSLPDGVVTWFDFGADGFTADLTPTVAESLSLLGASLEAVPLRDVAAVTGGKGGGGKGGSGGGGGSTTQNPMTWGVARVVNGSATATTVPSSLPGAGAGVTVAVLDTGVNTTHPDLARRLRTDIAGCYNYVAKAAGCADDNGHGTFVSGIIAADNGNASGGIYGVAPSTTLLTYKVCGSNGSCYADAAAAAIYDAVSNGAQIINMSFGGTTGFSVEEKALQSAATAGVLNVASVGNTKSTSTLCTSIHYPASFTTVVSAAATDKYDSVPFSSCRGYNDGDLTRERGEIDVAMPGVSVTSTTRSGGYATGSGTSNSAAYVSGLAASVWSAKGGASGVRGWLDSLADYDVTKSSGGGAKLGVDAASGFGLAYLH